MTNVVTGSGENKKNQTRQQTIAAINAGSSSRKHCAGLCAYREKTAFLPKCLGANRWVLTLMRRSEIVVDGDGRVFALVCDRSAKRSRRWRQKLVFCFHDCVKLLSYINQRRFFQYWSGGDKFWFRENLKSSSLFKSCCGGGEFWLKLFCCGWKLKSSDTNPPIVKDSVVWSPPRRNWFWFEL